MHFHLLKPLHGWRAFLGEVGVVLLGVLLALGAQQLIADIQTRADVRTFRETIDHEIGLNLFVYDVRAKEFGCVARRVVELRTWLAQAGSVASVPPIFAASPDIITPYRSSWDNRDAAVFNHLPTIVRQKYAEFYDELANNWSQMQEENETWHHLSPYKEPGPITLADRRAIGPAIDSIQFFNESLAGNFLVSREIARVLNVGPIKPDNISPSFLQRLKNCRSIFAPPPAQCSYGCGG